MRFSRVLMLGFIDRDLEPEDWSEVEQLTDTLVRREGGEPELSTELSQVDCLLVALGVDVTASMLEASPRLRYLGVFGTSTSRIDPSVRSRDVTVRNVPDYGTEGVAELAIAIALDHLRDLWRSRSRAAGGDLSEPKMEGAELRGRRVGVVGLGAIGARVAEIARLGFGAEVSYWSRSEHPAAGLPRLELDALLARSEIVFVHVALASETRELLDAARLALLPEGALLVHLAPPEILDLTALTACVRRGILSFATDHGDEMAPAELEALRALPSCVLYPPIGYGTREARSRRRERFLGDLRAFLDS